MSEVVQRPVCDVELRTVVVMRIPVLKWGSSEYLMVVVGRVRSGDDGGKLVLLWPVLMVWVFLLVYLHLGTGAAALA